MIGKVLWDEFFTNSDWPLASAVAICLLVLLVGPIALFQRQQAKSLERQLMMGRARFAFTVLAFGYAFLYLPIALVIVYSFNESRLVTVWARLLDQMVERAVRQRGDAATPPGCRCASRW